MISSSRVFQLGHKNSTDNFSKSFMYSIHQMYFLVQKHLEHTLLQHKSISFSQFMILVGCNCSSLSSPDKAVSQSAIAEQLYLTEATVSRHISTLVDLGYLSKKNDTANRRKHKIIVTKKGAMSFTKAETIINKELEMIFSVIKKSNRTLIIQNFERVLSLLLVKK